MASKGKRTERSAFDLSQVRNRIIGHIDLTPAEILDHPGQAWDHPDYQARALHGILQEVGITDDLLVYKSARAGDRWVTIDGHLRKSLDPQKTWPCRILDVTDAEADYILATHDQVGMMKKANAEAIDALLSEISSANNDVQQMLTDMAQNAGLYLERPAEPEAEVEPDQAAALQAQWRVQVGQVWQAGPQRLICGDCREQAVWQTLLGDAAVDGIMTSPPYAEQRKDYYASVAVADYVAWWHAVQHNAARYLAPTGSFLLNIKPHCDDGQRVLYVFDLVLAMVRQWGWLLIDEFCWPHQTLPGNWPNRFRNGFEPIYHFARQTSLTFNPQAVAQPSDMIPVGKGGMQQAASGRWHLDKTTNSTHKAGLALPDNVLWFDRNQDSLAHGAVFPVKLPAFFMQAFSHRNAGWLDPFCGSRTVLVAAQQTGRRGYGIEIAPQYCAVALQRLTDMGLAPELVA